jgi:hypothetical protein
MSVRVDQADGKSEAREIVVNAKFGGIVSKRAFQGAYSKTLTSPLLFRLGSEFDQEEQKKAAIEYRSQKRSDIKRHSKA